MASVIHWEEAKNKLRIWREENVRNSEEVIEIWLNSLSTKIQKLGDEKWLVYEQVCIAAFDCHNEEIIQTCVSALDQQFPGSLRVKKLKGMHSEMEGRYEEALNIYDHILQFDESNAVIHKRKIALLKSQNQIPEAIKELTDYLKRFMSDQEAWMELADLYILEQDFNKAAFCIEELILSSPNNHLYHQKYAEIQYTIGGFENLEFARAYFSQALKLNPRNMRALYGLYLSASSIASSPKCPALKKKENLKFASWATSKIFSQYQEKLSSENQLKIIESSLNALQISNPN